MSESNSKIVLNLVIRTFLQEIRTLSHDAEEGTELGFPCSPDDCSGHWAMLSSYSLALSPPLMASRTFNYLYQVQQLQQERLRHIACTCSSICILHINKNFKSWTLLGQRIIFWPVLCIMWQKGKENGHGIYNSVFQLFHCCLQMHALTNTCKIW